LADLKAMNRAPEAECDSPGFDLGTLPSVPADFDKSAVTSKNMQGGLAL
jgi:hypothetical protein